MNAQQQLEVEIGLLERAHDNARNTVAGLERTLNRSRSLGARVYGGPLDVSRIEKALAKATEDYQKTKSELESAWAKRAK